VYAVIHGPILLSRGEIRRLQRGAPLLVLANPRSGTGTYPVYELEVFRRNRDRHERSEAYRLTLEIEAVRSCRLHDLDYEIARRAGHRTQRDFYDCWLERYRCITPGQLVVVASVRVVDTPRLLHRQVHRGYTRNPSQAAFGEPEALSRDDLQRLSMRARERHEARVKEAQARKPLPQRVRELELRAQTGDEQARRHLFMVSKHLDDAERRTPRPAA
jgi:hypothetical protein